ncbi:MAG: zinc finger Ran-binding domain-containing protein [Bacteroidia bacterium]|nr:zinc finger Ran-binding domain-containing protein [Bacteroidia bacterium]
MSQNLNTNDQSFSPEVQGEEALSFGPTLAESKGYQGNKAKSHPMKSTPWTCGSCGHTNKAEDLECHSCGGKLPVVSLFKAQRVYLVDIQRIELSWEVHEADEVMLVPGNEYLPAKGTFEVSAEVGDLYVLMAKNQYGTRRLMTRARALPPQIHSFTCIDDKIQLGYPVIFQWDVEHCESLFISEVGEVTGRGYAEVEIRKPGIYTLTAKNESGEVSKNLELFLPQPEVSSFYAASETVELGMPITLFWEAHNYESLRLMPYGLDVTEKTSHDVYPDRTTDFYLLAKNLSGDVMRKVTLRLPPPRISYFGSEDGISTEGSPVELRWQVENAFKVTMNQGIGEVPVNGTIEVRPEKAYTDYEIIAIGHSGVEKSSFRVTRFPIPLEEQMFLLDTPDPYELTLQLPPPNKQLMPMPQRKNENPTTEEEIAKEQDYQVWRAQQMMLTDDLMRMEKASIRTEFKKIIARLKKKKTSQNKG